VTGVLVLLVVTPALEGCGRRLPGPDECHELAVRWEQAERGAWMRELGRHALELSDTSDEDPVLELTTECLTTPYDRELVACGMSSVSPRVCLRQFERRRGITPGLNSPRPY